MATRGDQRGQDMAAFAAGFDVPAAAAISLGSSPRAMSNTILGTLLLLIGP